MASPRSYDVKISVPDTDREGLFQFGPQGTVKLGNFLKEPAPKGRVDSIVIQSLHHGGGRLISTDPYTYRDTNATDIAADARQFGYIMPGGEYTELGEEDIVDATLIGLGAASFIDNANGLAIFAIGNQIFSVDLDTDAVAEIDISMVSDLPMDFRFTGSVAFWGGQFILGMCDESTRDAVGSLTYPGLTFYDDGTGASPSGVITGEYKVSWIASTSQGLFWIQNDAGSPPRMFWTDRTDQAWGSFSQDADPTLNFLYGPFFLEIPTLEITGMTVAGTVPVFASADKMLWAFDSTEVFVPLTPIHMQPTDHGFGKNMPYVLDWIAVPHNSGISRFDPRSYQSIDITPGSHQGSPPNFSAATNFAVDAACTTPTGAAIAHRWQSVNPDLLLLEVYQDGMFYHFASLGAVMDMTQVLGLIYATNSNQNPSIYILGDSGSSEYKFGKYYLSGPGAMRAPVELAETSSLRTPNLSGRPPDISIQPMQIRGWASASETNPVTISLELDGELVEVGVIDSEGPYVLTLPEDTVPCRRLSWIGTFTQDDNTPSFITLPISIDYVFVPPAGSLSPDLVSIKFMATSNAIDKLTGRRSTSAVGDSDFTSSLQGEKVEVKFFDREDSWLCIVHDVNSTLVAQDDGLNSGEYMVEMALKRIR